MSKSARTLRDAVREAQAQAEQVPVPAFDAVWASAVVQAGTARKRYVPLAASVAAVAAIAIVFVLRTPVDEEWQYIDEYELLETTGWSAPSDSLLPDREFDIYRDTPELIESTEPYGGALL